MLKRTIVFGSILAVLVAMGSTSAFAQGDKAAAKTSAAPKATTEKTAVKAPHAAATHSVTANEIAVCGCGKVFVPDANTKYIEHDGKKYACCTDGCHKMAMADPAAAAKMADDNMAKVMSQLNPPKTAPESTPKTN